MITVVGGTKGGSGKTTVATTLAVMRASAGRDVLLVDCDEQQTSATFTLQRNQARPDGAGYSCVSLRGKAVVPEVKRLAPKYQDVVIDTGGHDAASQRAALVVCDTYLVPFAPRSFDVWTIDKVAELVEEALALNPGLKAFSFLNRADPRGRDNEGAAEVLSSKPSIAFLPAALGNRKAYAYAAAEGLAVTELLPRDKQAIDEVTAFYAAVYGEAAPGA